MNEKPATGTLRVKMDSPRCSRRRLLDVVNAEQARVAEERCCGSHVASSASLRHP